MRSSEIRCEVQKFISEFASRFVNKGSDWPLNLAKPIKCLVYKPAWEFWNELSNFATNFRTSERSSECYSEKLSEIDNNCSFAQAFALHFWQFIFPLSCRRRPVLQVFRLSAKKDILKNFLFVMMTNVMVKACLNQKIIKISNLIQVKENSAMSEIVTYAKAEFFRKPNSSEYRMYRSVDWTHDMIIVRWQLLIWHKRKLCALTNRPPAQSTGTDQWLSRLFHANCSAAQVYVLNPWQYIFAQSCWRRSVLHVFLSFYQ